MIERSEISAAYGYAPSDSSQRRRTAGAAHYAEVLQPERFLELGGNAVTRMPQGGGDHYRHHRCLGEGIAIADGESATTFHAVRVSYTAPAQDMEIDMRRLPALPRSGFVLSGVRVTV